MKSVLRKGPKKTVKIFKHDLVVDVRVRLNYTKRRTKCASKWSTAWKEA